METVKIDLTPSGPEVMVRTGDAPEIRQPKGFSITATIASVIDFYKKRLEIMTASNCLVKIDRNKCQVILVVNDKIEEEKIIITGEMRPNIDFVDLGINASKMFSAANLELALRKRPHLFNSVDVYNSFMKSLRTYTYEVNGKVSKADNRQGNASESASMDLAHTMEKSIQLKISPWADAPAQTTDLMIYVSLTSGHPEFYLESTDLMLRTEALKDEALKNAESELSALPVLYV